MYIDEIKIYFKSSYHNFMLHIYNLESYDNFCIRLYKVHKGDNYLSDMDEIFSTWIDSDGGEVAGNCEIYKDGYGKVIDYVYKVFNNIVVNKGVI